jgi:hypothetical protein
LFSYGKNPFDLYRYKYSNTEFYQNVNPYAELYYVMGKEREQDFRVLFTQNVWRGLNVGAEFNVISSPGVYMRTFTHHNNIRVFSNFISKNKHYRAIAGYYFNKFEVNENGGIDVDYDSLEMISEISDKKAIDIRRQQAENAWKENSFYLKQSYHFGVGRNDTMPNSGINFGYLSHAMEITRYATMYRDNSLDSASYPAVYRSPSQTFDSTFVSLIRNTVSWNIGDVTSLRNAQFFNLSVGAISDIATVSTDSVYSKTYNYLYPFAKLRLNYANKLILDAGATVLYDVETHHDFSANAKLNYVFNTTKPQNHLFAEVNFNTVRPRPFQTNYISNHYQWDTAFNNSQTLNFAVGLRWKGFYLRGEMASFFDYIYLSDADRQFVQTNEAFSVYKASLEKTFKWWYLALDTRVVAQIRPTGPLMQFPKFSTRNALYFDFPLLGSTPIQVGVEMYYNTPYLSRFYNPTLASFYGQGDLETGGFMYLDAFLNLRVQRANLFFKFSNLGANFMGYNYMMTDGYPVLDRAFKFGVLWRFFD